MVPAAAIRHLRAKVDIPKRLALTITSPASRESYYANTDDNLALRYIARKYQGITNLGIRWHTDKPLIPEFLEN